MTPSGGKSSIGAVTNNKGGNMDSKQMKLNELKAMVRAWKREKSMAVAYEICEFLANNLNLEDGEWNYAIKRQGM